MGEWYRSSEVEVHMVAVPQVPLYSDRSADCTEIKLTAGKGSRYNRKIQRLSIINKQVCLP